MPRLDGIFKRHVSVAATTNDQKDVVIATNKTWVVGAISMTAPGLTDCRVKLMWDAAGAGSAPSKVYESAIADKFVSPVGLHFEGDGVKILRIQLENDHATDAQYMGCTVYYEELG